MTLSRAVELVVLTTLTEESDAYVTMTMWKERKL